MLVPVLFFLVSFRSFCILSSKCSIPAVVEKTLAHGQQLPSFPSSSIFWSWILKQAEESVVILQFSNQSHRSLYHVVLYHLPSVFMTIFLLVLHKNSMKWILYPALWKRTLQHGLRSRKFDNHRVLSTLLQLPLILRKFSLFTNDLVHCDTCSVKTWF